MGIGDVLQFFFAKKAKGPIPYTLLYRYRVIGV